MKPLEERYLKLIDTALAVPLENREFSQFLESALEYFYGAEKTGTPAGDLARAETQDEMLRSDRIARLFEASADTLAAPDDPDGLATLTIDGALVAGNAAAKAMFQCRFPISFDALPIDDGLKEAVAEMNGAAPVGGTPRLLLAQPDLETSPVSLAVLRPAPSGGVQVTFSFVDGSEERMSRFAHALGLTRSEREVLRGYLQGLSRREIAEARGTSDETVKAQSKSILQKTGCTRVADLVPLATTLAFVLDAAPTPSPPVQTEPPVEIAPIRLELADRTIECRRYGEGRRTLLFQHGQPIGPFFTKAFLRILDAQDLSIIAPSRPGYGGTSLPAWGADYLQTVSDDVRIILAHEEIETIFLAGHQLGGAYAFALAERLEQPVLGAISLNGGAPIDDTVFATMDRWSRLIATGIRHAPSVIRMALSLGIGDYRRRSPQSFVVDRYKDVAVDRRSLEDASVMSLNCRGVDHMIAQDASSFIDDQGLKLSDWTALYERCLAPALWLVPDQCRIMSPAHVMQFAVRNLRAQVVEITGAGSQALYSHDTLLAKEVARFCAEELRGRDA